MTSRAGSKCRHCLVRLCRAQVRLRCAAQHMYYSSTFGEIMGEDGRFGKSRDLLRPSRVADIAVCPYLR